MRKIIKTVYLEEQVYNWLSKQENASKYINDLVKEKMKEKGVYVEDAKKEPVLNLSKVKKRILNILTEKKEGVLLIDILDMLQDEFPWLKISMLKKHLLDLVRARLIEIEKNEYGNYVIKLVKNKQQENKELIEQHNI